MLNASTKRKYHFALAKTSQTFENKEIKKKWTKCQFSENFCTFKFGCTSLQQQSL